MSIAEQLKLEPEEFDKQFLAWLDKQVKADCGRVTGMAKDDEGPLAAGASQQSHDDVIKRRRRQYRYVSRIRRRQERL